MQISGKIKRVFAAAAAVAMAAVLALGAACSDKESDDQTSSDNPIISMTAIGMVDYDGVKLRAMALEYDCDLTGADISAETYDIMVFSSMKCDYIGDGEIGDITDIYVNDEIATSDSGGSGSGRYVIIEVFTDYMSSTNLLYNRTMSVRAKQVKDIHLASGETISACDEYANNISGATTTSYSFIIPEIEGFSYYTDDPGEFGAAGGAFVAENCFSQQDGLYHDVSLSYALYLPEGYSKDGNYALITLQNPAASAGTHPKAAVLTYRSAAVYASEMAQNIVKEEHGLDGLIVLVPVITERVNDNGGTPAEYEAVVKLWDYIIEEYNVDENYVYGSGQSVGGMILLETNRNRDNFFAGMLLYDDQWAQNYYIDTIFARDMVASAATAASAEMHYPRTDEYITWNYSLGTDGEMVYDGHDPYNYYYLVSDDNILVINCDDNNLSNDSWTEMKYLYYDLTGYELDRCIINSSDSLDDQNSALRSYLGRDNELNINWVSLENATEGFHNRKLDESYIWLLSQSRQDEIAREKLDLNKPFELADEQIKEGRETHFTYADGSTVYYLTGKSGAGTQFYNSGWFNTNTVADAAPGWLPDGLSWETGVSGATIKGATVISATAIAIEYSADMSGLVARLAGDKVYNHISGEYRDDDFITLAPFAFYDADGNAIECTITNIYVNSSASVVEDAERASGSGCYVIVEFSSALASTPDTVKQQATIYTTGGILAPAYPWKYTVTAV